MPQTISIISICFNNLEALLQTCASVDKQTVLPHEHWIIDGSTNNEISNYLAEHPQPGYRKWINEKDEGIADAFNKGINHSTGTLLNMLNSGDCYLHEKVLATVMDIFDTLPGIAWMHSKIKVQRAQVAVIIGKPFEKEKLYRGMRSLSHQSMFVRRELHTKYGLYNKNLRYSMDYDFVCSIANEPLYFYDQPLIESEPGGITSVQYLKAMAQGRAVYEAHFGYSFKLVLWQLRLKVLHYLLNSPIGKFLYKLKVWLNLENL